jgi:CIC family chloride channel protein
MTKIHTEDEQLCSPIVMLALAFLTGIFGGFGSIVFKAIIAFFHSVFFYGTVSLKMDPNAYMEPARWGAGIILVPVVASFIVTWVVRTFAPEARGHGVPEVLNAIYHKDGRIRPSIVFAKAIVSAISIGTGGSVGREGPIVQVGSAFGSLLGQVVRMPVRQRIILIAAGAAAGVAATFNAPIGGLAFAIELLLVSINARTVSLVAVATVTATYIGRLYGGLAPSFDVPKLALFEDPVQRLGSLAFCLPLGILVGIAAAVFIRSIYIAEDAFVARIKNDYLRHATGMLGIGLMLYAFMHFTGHYYVGGVGYATVMDALNGSLSNPWFLALLFVGKLLATDITIGSGASGGVFSPSLFLGATMGACFGNLIAWAFPALAVNPALFTVAAMAAMVAGSTGAVLTAIVMTFEQTRDYGVILPIILTVAVAHIVRVRLCKESIYTLKLSRRGNHVPQGLQAAVSARGHAKIIMSTNFKLVDIAGLETWLDSYIPGKDPRYTLVTRDGTVIGFVQEELLYLLRGEHPEKIIDAKLNIVVEQTKWPVLMRSMRARNTETTLVSRVSGSLRAEDILGIITPRELFKHAGHDAELMD